MVELASFGGQRSYEDFKRQVPPNILPLFEKIREYCLSLGKNVVEDIRMHRIVFGKSMTFRWFADVAPTSDHVEIKIQKNRKEHAQIIQVEPGQDLIETQGLLKEAYELIH